MIDRRELLKWGALTPAFAAVPTGCFAQSAQRLDALLLDSRHVGPDLQGPGSARLYRFDGDVTAFWYNVLDRVWRRPGFVLGGITGRDALFVLETLAGDRGRRVVSRKLLPARGDGEGPIGWVIAPVHPSVRA